MSPKVAIIISTCNRKNLLKQSLESLFNSFDKIKPDVYVYDDGSKDETNKLLTEYFKDGKIQCKISSENKGLRVALSVLLFWVFQGDYDYISYSQDDVAYKKGWLDRCVMAWKGMEDAPNNKPNVFGFITGHDAPEHPIKKEIKLGNSNFIIKDSCRATHLFASTKRWKEFGEIPDLTPGIAAPKPGQGSMVDWWLIRDGPNSLTRKGEKVLCIPGLIAHFGVKHSHWGAWNQENWFVV